MKLRHYILLGALFIVPLMSPLLFQTVKNTGSELDVPSYHVTEYRGIEKFPNIKSIHEALHQACQYKQVQIITQELEGGGVTSSALTVDNISVTITTNPTKGFAVTCAYDDTGEDYSQTPFAQLFNAKEVITREI